MRELPSDLWQWPDLTDEELVELLRRGPSVAPDDPFFQYEAVRRCNALKAEIDGGSGFAVLAAVRICGTHGLVMPEWLSYAFNRRYDAVLNCRASSWDDSLSFGKPYPKGTNINALRKARKGRMSVVLAAVSLLKSEPETPIDKHFFERIGRPLRLGITLTQEYYYAGRSQFAWMTEYFFGDHARLNVAKKRKTAGRQKPRR